MLKTIFCLFALFFWMSGCADETATDAGDGASAGDDSGAAVEEPAEESETSCDSAETCAAAFDSTECNPPVLGEEGVSGNSWNYEEALADEFSEEQVLCIAGYADADEFALGCLTYDGALLTAIAAEDDPCDIDDGDNGDEGGADPDSGSATCSTPSECSDDFDSFLATNWSLLREECFDLTAEEGALTFLSTQAEGCNTGANTFITKNTTMSIGSIQVTFTDWNNLDLTGSNTDTLVLSLSNADETSAGAVIMLAPCSGCLPTFPLNCSFTRNTEGNAEQISSTVGDENPCAFEYTDSGPLVLRLEKSGNNISASFDAGAGFVDLGETTEVPNLGNDIQIGISLRELGGNTPLSVTVDDFVVTFD